MKATGIVRRMDDLGRVVIPKEIRRTMKIREGDPLEIYTDRQGEVIFKKYSPVKEISELALYCVNALNRAAGGVFAVCDKDAVIACAGMPAGGITDREITKDAAELMEKRVPYIHTRDPLYPTEDCRYYIYAASPIICDGDVTGLVAALTEDGRADAAAPKLTLAAAHFISYGII